MAIKYPIIPEQITVHLGPPSEATRNITIPFTDYIKNVASSEIYPTWPESALRANILVIISFALNRIYNEWYKSKGYNFDITSLPSYDQTFIENRTIYGNISDLVDEIFNEYVYKSGQVQPLFTKYCDGRKTTCNGLSQWGSVSLANQNKTPLEILRYYYGNDTLIKTNVEVGEVSEGYPGYEIGPGQVGNPVRLIERDLKRIKQNYPAIPEITDTQGVYSQELSEAVSKFQEIFALPVTGIVDKATWYKIKYVYNSVKKLADLYSEGISKEEAEFIYREELKYGDTGIEVEYINYYLSAIAFLDPDIPYLKTNSVYNDATKTMVMAFQGKYGLPVTGIFTYDDWGVLKKTYDKLLNSLNLTQSQYLDELYPGYFLSIGMQNDDVKRLQRFLLAICRYDKSIPGVRVNGIYDDLTARSIYKLQNDYGYEKNDYVGPLLWKRIVELSKR